MRASTVGFLVVALLELSSTLAADDAASYRTLAQGIFKELIEINTTDTPRGNVTTAALAMQKHLLDAGFAKADVVIAGPTERKQNLVVRLHGTSAHRPLLLIGHLDVVEARPEDWTTDPFKLIAKDGYFYGRGTQDMKSGDAIMMTTLIRLKKENAALDRDLILALTADEEGGAYDGVDWLVRNRRPLIDAQYVINYDGTSVVQANGKPQYFEVNVSEKAYADYQLTVTNKGGHSSLPVPDNAIYALTDAVSHIGRYEFPLELNGATRGYYEEMSTIEIGARAADLRAILQPTPDPKAAQRLSQDPEDNAQLHTTCVATRLDAGHANNALPQKAQAVVNCRILPGHSPEEVRQQLLRVIANPQVGVRFIDVDGKILEQAPATRSLPPPPLSPELFVPLRKLVASTWPNLKVLPTMMVGASDGVITMAAGMPTFVIAPIPIERGQSRAHGRDERLSVEGFYAGNEFFYRYIRTLTTH